MKTAGPSLHKGFKHAALLLALMMPCLGTSALAQTNDSSGILFLHLQLTNNSVSLLDSSVRPGYLKPRPNDDLPDGIHFEITDAAGQRLWKGAIQDPGSRVIEYEDPPGSGKLKSKKVHLNVTEFTVRVPVLAGAERIEFYALSPSASGKDTQQKSLGSLRLPAP